MNIEILTKNQIEKIIKDKISIELNLIYKEMEKLRKNLIKLDEELIVLKGGKS